MDKLQAYHSFWSNFSWKAYDETSVPIAEDRIKMNGAAYPYNTYELSEDFFGHDLALTASLWDRSESWESVVDKAREISNYIGQGGVLIHYDGGAFWIRRGTPWAQRMSDESDDSVRRIVLNIVVEFIDI